MVKIKWQKEAKQDLFEICKYYRCIKRSPQTANNIKKAIFDAVCNLETFPEQGTKELALSDDDVCFRYLGGRKINCVMRYLPFKLIGRGSASAKGVHQHSRRA